MCPIRSIDASSSTSAMIPSFSFSSPTDMMSNAPLSNVYRGGGGDGAGVSGLKPLTGDDQVSDSSSIFVTSTRTQVSVRNRSSDQRYMERSKRRLSFVSHASCNIQFSFRFWFFLFACGSLFCMLCFLLFYSILFFHTNLLLFLSLAVKSGGYYMFEDFDTEPVELNHKVRESLIPDPEGNEIRHLAKSKGFTAVSFYSI